MTVHALIWRPPWMAEGRAMQDAYMDIGGRATQDAYMDIGGRATQEQLPSSCRAIAENSGAGREPKSNI